MALLFFILVVIVSIVLAFFVLIQNPEGGGLSGSIGGFSNQIMGVKKTNNVLEKGTWLFALIIGIMCLFSVVLFTGSHGGGGALDNLNTNVKMQTTQPRAQSAAPAAEAPASQPADQPAETPAK
ncbi:preprotein translocase subunit SecG [Arachidicoccus ginsenosidivorans]|jgi:preprotein translocase subunit SecG|uniref:Protein-export membrane protein SecG n=1 Tax=Arachidicoccus ginsenosidivorans TaxID=496057 RepID=A0A5B8VKW5_9BACT|nr:preprotein translocase subunit SecG [Arachidicoccus ginsenosidivorans]QEC72150.1 preprotein translocase subunit SecG [Arachidicoccus ginsenosidivorans]